MFIMVKSHKLIFYQDHKKLNTVFLYVLYIYICTYILHTNRYIWYVCVCGGREREYACFPLD